MTDRYYAVVGRTFVVPLAEITNEEMRSLKEDRKRNQYCAVPVFYSKDMGVWPEPDSSTEVVKVVDVSAAR